MVQTLAINAQNDIYLGTNGNIVVASGVTAIENACLTGARAQLGEMVLQQSLGLPSFQTIWTGTPDYAIYEAYLTNTLLDIDGVTSVDSISITAINNTFAYRAQLRTIYGPLTLNG